MKIIEKRKIIYEYATARYDLSGGYAGKKNVQIGVLILFILEKSGDFELEGMTAEANGDIGEERNILHVESDDSAKVFESVEVLADIFRSQELVVWKLRGKYQNTDVVLTGRTYGSIVSARIPLRSKLNLIPWMSAVENATFEYHDFDTVLIDTLKRKFKMSQKMAIQSILDLQKELDIWSEFAQGVESDSFAFPEENAIAVEGMTAEHLYKNYPLSELGAYNYLIYLRNDPKNAIADLKNGLPRK